MTYWKHLADHRRRRRDVTTQRLMTSAHSCRADSAPSY